MRKATKIEYNPFTNLIHFRISRSTDGPWDELDGSSDLLRFANEPVLFTNCVTDIVQIINQKQNSTSDGIEVLFSGPDSDFDALCRAAARQERESEGKGPLVCRHIETFKPSHELLEQVRGCYSRIASEFSSFLPGQPMHAGEGAAIGDAIAAFEETISDAIPVCVIGNMSVGKSALINSLIGEEILPSKENPTTARNVKLLESDRFAVGVTYEVADGETAHLTFEVRPGRMLPVGGGLPCGVVCGRLAKLVSPEGKSAPLIVRELVEFLNEMPGEEEGSELLEKIGWNVTVEVPFRHGYATDDDNPVVLFDTPGSDNADIDHEKHDAALKEFLGSQTNALPVLVTCRDQIVRQDTNTIREQIDRYSDNFSSPCCIVVLTKCDHQTKKGLEESVPAVIRNWHGKSIILYTTPIGALGLRKPSGDEWLDEGYEEVFANWRDRQSGRNRVCLPDYNINPRADMVTWEDLGSSRELFETGIPSLEHEIAYYIDNFARYKKCVRGRRDLLDSLVKVRELLRIQELRAGEKKEEEKRRKIAERERLLAELDAIALPEADGFADEVAYMFDDELEDYCDSLEGLLGGLYDEYKDLDPLEMNRRISDELREHCQKNLIDVCYLRPDGAKDRIIGKMSSIAWGYAQMLQSFVENNDSHFTEVGGKTLRNLLFQDLKMPEFRDERGVLGDLAEIFDQLVLLRSGFYRLINKPEVARENWLRDKQGAFERKLRDGRDIFGAPRHGTFVATVLDSPIALYYAQLTKWAEGYRGYIKGELDKDNSLLSGMEAEIRQLEDEVDDLRDRLGRLDDVERELDGLLDPIRIGGEHGEDA